MPSEVVSFMVGLLGLTGVVITTGINLYIASSTRALQKELAERTAELGRDLAKLNQSLNKELKDVDFKNSFNMKILEKRMSIYSELAEVLGKLNAITPVLDKGSKVVPSVILDREMFDSIFADLQILKNKQRWMSSETSKLFRNLCNIMLSIRDGVDPDDYNYSADLVAKAQQMYITLQKLMNQADIDFMSLYEVENFSPLHIKITDKKDSMLVLEPGTSHIIVPYGREEDWCEKHNQSRSE